MIRSVDGRVAESKDSQGNLIDKDGFIVEKHDPLAPSDILKEREIESLPDYRTPDGKR